MTIRTRQGGCIPSCAASSETKLVEGSIVKFTTLWDAAICQDLNDLIKIF